MADKNVDLDDTKNEDKLIFGPLLLWNYVYTNLIIGRFWHRPTCLRAESSNDRYNFNATLSLVNRFLILIGFFFIWILSQILYLFNFLTIILGVLFHWFCPKNYGDN